MIAGDLEGTSEGTPPPLTGDGACRMTFRVSSDTQQALAFGSAFDVRRAGLSSGSALTAKHENSPLIPGSPHEMWGPCGPLAGRYGTVVMSLMGRAPLVGTSRRARLLGGSGRGEPF